LDYNRGMENKLRALPSVDRLLGEDRIKDLAKLFPRELVVDLARETLENARTGLAAGRPAPTIDDIIRDICAQGEALARPSLRPLINATGVVLHTNLGRAPLSDEAIEAMQAAGRGYNNLEFDIATGQRGSRNSHLEELLRRLSGAEAGLVVNNNASAVMLGLSALAKRGEVIVSRGQAVEIGGGFRIPEVLRQSGAKLVEVGTTNCTYLRDYEQAFTPKTAALLRVHSSNFKVLGFTQMVTLEELSGLAKARGVPLLDDLGSGCPLDTAAFGLEHEPTIRESVEGGADLAFFSGDKLLGGPQAGIVVGKKTYIDKLKKHPLMRALRIDKTRIAALSATLRHYLKGEATQKIPVWRMISLPLNEIERRAGLWAAAFSPPAEVVAGESLIGGGSLPGATLPTRLVSLGRSSQEAGRLADALRRGDPPIIGRISENRLLLDPRSVDPEQDGLVIAGLKALTSKIEKKSL
jgi:L-seryl-tRNA(Ser) seleniumtransferase